MRPSASAPLRILLVEDQEAGIGRTREMLGTAGFELRTVRTLRAALACAGEEAVDALLLDLSLADGVGRETVRTLAERAPHVPIVVLDDLQDEARARSAVANGAQDYLAKDSIDAAALQRVLRHTIERHRLEKERLHLERQLSHSRKLEAIGQLAAGIAHEINTPTQYVSDNTRFLRDALDDLVGVLEGLRRAADDGRPLPPMELRELLDQADVEYLLAEIPRSLEQSLEGLGHVSRIVRAMKELSHPASDEKTPTDLNKALEATILVASNEWKYVAEMETELEPALPPVPCLPGEMNQVFLNLIVNAAHAIGELTVPDGGTKGTIRVTTSTGLDGWVEIRIADSGCGIPQECRERVFQPFFTTKGVGKGTGQGLAIAHDVVVRHGGSIAFESEVGRGTTFLVRIPAVASAAA